jgi:hypothetical protein
VALVKQSVIRQFSEALLQRSSTPKQKVLGRVKRERDSHARAPGCSGNGDPTLGANDAYLQSKLVLVTQDESSEHTVGGRLPDGLLASDRGRTAAAIEVSADSLVTSAVAKLVEAMEKRFPKEPELGPKGVLVYAPPVDDGYPTVLPSPPSKTGKQP